MRASLVFWLAMAAAAPLYADQTGRRLIVRGPDGAVHRYRFDRVLGSGWSASGYLAHDEATQRVVVIKVQSQRWLDDGRAETLSHEARLLRRLGGRHTSLPQGLGLGQTSDGRPALVMEHAPGRSLWGYEEQPLPRRRAIHIALRLLDAIAALHAQGYKHNDLHPGNVFYDPATDQLTLLDLGNSTLIADEFKVANDKYGPPEQRRDSPMSMKGDASTDLYHAGGILAHLLTARHPDPERPDDIAAQIDDAALRAIVRKARDADPNQRYRSAAEMRAALIRSR